jgi:hypothetical protein
MDSPDASFDWAPRAAYAADDDAVKRVETPM